ncbi:peptidylprolyl isomerase [Mesobacterium sp. TK19101]|uniref:Parvulin-like PPIase n=1 Tax=Mesobacterium hydrothermale TaxID=3111907 RepID=A0ABU6HFL7_9RHOB|nr:peptidylprolyl isomerase [Mesobacterium sp. TK19101]MEC3860635.1 peptidylprolyl isomerase [Mesobacterium sp. TK19101]
MTPALPRLATLVCAAMLALAAPLAQAQGLFSPVIRVNDMVITGYEIEQRAQMLRVLRAPGDPIEVARDQLIDDRLRVEAARTAGVEPTPEEVQQGMEEFAQRANLSREEFVKALAQQGVAEQTFRDFVKAGVSWRQLVQAKYAGRVTVSDAELDRALSGAGRGSNIRVLMSEIIMPAPPAQNAAVMERANRISQSKSEAEFSSFARQYSATPTRGAGGRLPWQNLTDLPPVLQPIILGLAPGDVTDPLPIPNAVALFQLRAIEETGYAAPEIGAVEYATYMIPGGRDPKALAQARVIASKLDRCDDLYGIAKGQPEEVLQRVTLPPSDISNDIAIELSKMDPGEVSTTLTRNGGQTLMLLMLCGRTLKLTEDADREQLSLGLRNQRLTSMSDSFLAELRAQARIVQK